MVGLDEANNYYKGTQFFIYVFLHTKEMLYNVDKM
jgi:hypothetical protein